MRNALPDAVTSASEGYVRIRTPRMPSARMVTENVKGMFSHIQRDLAITSSTILVHWVEILKLKFVRNLAN